MGNDDHSRFLRRDGDEWVMMEHDGPGVLTRLWFTGREDGSRDQSYLDTAVLHLYVDGREISFGDGERGVPIGTLAGGGLAGFPRPWVADREVASGALLAFMPIPFQSSVRVSVSDIDLDGRSLYYQIDWRELPNCFCKRRLKLSESTSPRIIESPQCPILTFLFFESDNASKKYLS